MTIGLTGAMLREHRWTYAGLVVVLVSASVVVGSSLILFEAARSTDLSVAGLDANAAAKRFILAENGRFISAFMTVLGVFVAVLLVSQTMSVVVDGRRRELALFRLVGASPRQTTWMVLKESIVIGLICSSVGAVLSVPLASPYAAILSRQNNWPQGLPVAIHVSAMIWCVIMMTLVSVAGALNAAHRIGHVSPVEAVGALTRGSRTMPLTRWVLAGIGGIALAVFLMIPPERLNYQITCAGAGGGAVLLVSALAPIVVPAIAKVLGGVITPIAPGAGLVARQYAVHNARRSAALATPIIILLGFGSVFGMLAQTGRSEKAVGLEALNHTDAVAELGIHGPDGSGFLRTADALPEVAVLTHVERADGWAWDQPGMPADDYPQLTGIDPATFNNFIPAKFEAGNIEDISGTDVAAFSGFAKVGDTFRMEAPDGTSFTVHVTAVVEPTSFIYGTFLTDLKGLPLDAGTTTDTWLAESAPEVAPTELARSLDKAVPSAAVLTHESWVEQSVADSVASQRSAILTIVGGAAILALFSLAQSTLSSVRERRHEIDLLLQVGARRRSIVGLVLVESSIITATASILAIAVTGVVYARMTSGVEALSPALSPIVPVDILVFILAACVIVSIASAVAGAVHSLHRIKGSALTN